MIYANDLDSPTAGTLNPVIERRRFLARLPGAFLAAAARPLTAEEPLHVLSGGDIQRLRLDFNASRSQVRLLFLLSPT